FLPPPTRRSSDLHRRADLLAESGRLRGRLVHFPVACNERFAHTFPTFPPWNPPRAPDLRDEPAPTVNGRRNKPPAGRHSVLSCSAAIPGSSLPSRNSSDAPPPVDTWLIFSVNPYWAADDAEPPPPTMVTAPLPAMARATSSVPSAKGAHSKTPMGPFQTMVRARSISRANSRRVLGPMSSPCQSAGISSTSTTLRLASSANLSATTTSTG